MTRSEDLSYTRKYGQGQAYKENQELAETEIIRCNGGHVQILSRHLIDLAFLQCLPSLACLPVHTFFILLGVI